ncbi:MAG: FAD-dependent oxidoreductase [Desulfatibacillaceae bacterium]
MPRKQDFDVIVVGSGPGGATVTRELTKQRKKVLLLEWGSDEPLKGSLVQAAKWVGMPGKGTLFTHRGLSMVRGITAGGSSVFYYATAFDPPASMFNRYGIDVEDEVAEAKAELPIAPLSEDLMGPMAKRLRESAQDLGYDWHKLQKYVYQDRCRPNCDKCNLGCPHDAKWNARMYIDEAKEAGATFLPLAKVRNVLVENGKAVGVRYERFGKSYAVHAPRVVLAAGGIGTPVILRNSGIKQAGYDYFFDPLICVYGAVPDVKGGKEFPMVAGAHIEDEGYLMTDMTVPRLLYQAFAAQVLRVDKLLAHGNTLTIMVKARDTLGGRLTDSGGVRKHLAPQDEANLMKGYERARGILKNAGAKDVFKSWFVAAHPGGTAKVADIVDSNLQTEIEDLYVCDCAVIPEAWGLPPSLALIALGKRLARHLTGQQTDKHLKPGAVARATAEAAA